jgi:hypothetical protein
MRSRFLLSVVFFLITSIVAFSQNPHFTRDMEGIPLNISIEWGFSPLVHQQASEMGVDIYWNRVENITDNINTITDNDFKLLPISVRDASGQRFNWIEYYCDAKYSVWEAEGTDTTSVGYATLERSSSRTEIVHGTNETYIRTKPFVPDTTIMWGPYYYQEIEYIAYEDAVVDTLVTYNADFRLKLERNNSYPQNDTTSDNPVEPICKLLVTKSTLDSTWYISTVTIDSLILTRDDLPILNQFYTKSIIYDYLNIPPTENIGLQNHRRGIMGGVGGADYIEFKVIWLGSPAYLLSVDKVTVYDERGERLKTSNVPRTLIETQLSKLSSHQNLIVGQYGIDEPFSIDHFEPIRIVAQILRDNNQQLYLPFMGFWDGVWQDIGNPFGAQHLSPHKEFFMRTNGLVNIWQNAYMYDQPVKDNASIPYRFILEGYNDYRDINIMITAKNYKLAYSIDSLFGVSLQCSEQDNDVSHLRDPQPHEVLYNANLALLHGARFFDMYTYYAQRAPGNQEGFTTTGMIDYQKQPTDKWYMWRDVLKPRLHGLFGNTLKRLIPKFAEYRLGFNPSANYDLNLNRIKRVKLGNGQVPEALGTFADIGFFNLNGEEGNNYFMLLTRHYTDPNINNYKIEFRNLLNFKNWRLKNYIDDNDVTVVPNTIGYAESPSFALNRGDAILFSLHPVVNYGGKLTANETAGNGMTLYDKMIIESGATLTVNGTYTIQKDITVNDGGILLLQPGANLVFQNGAKLILKGGLTASGASANKITLDFTSQQNGNGIVTEDEDFLTATNCIIKMFCKR